MKKFLLFASFVLVASMAVYAHGQSEQPAAATKVTGPVTITLWHSLMGSKAAARKQIIANFEQKYPNITVKDLGFFDIDKNNQKMLTAMAAGDPPDLGSNHYYFVPQYASQGALQPLGPYFKASGINAKQRFLASTLSLNDYQGKIYGVPLFTTTRVILYNTDLFQQAGLNPNNPPKTWQELAQDAVKLTKTSNGNMEVSGFWAPNGTDTEMIMNFFVQLLWQQGGHIFNADRTKVEFASPQGVAALQFYADLFRKYKVNQIGFGAGTEGTQAPFYRNKAAMIMAGSYDLVTLKQMPSIHFKVALLPAPQGGKSVSLIDSFSLFMPKQAKHKAAAWDFIKYATSETAQVNFSKTSQRLPATAEAVKDPYFTQNPILQVFAHAIATGKAIPIVPQWAHIQTILAAEIQKVLAGQESAKAALDNVDSTVNNQIL